MKKTNYISENAHLLNECKIDRYLDMLSKEADAMPDCNAAWQDSINDIRDIYHRMLDTLRHNIEDPERGKIYNDLLLRAAQLGHDMMREKIIATDSLLSGVRQRGRGAEPLPVEPVRGKLENYVSDVAMLSLEQDKDKRTEKMTECSAAHWDYLNIVFDNVIASRRWSHETSAAMASMLVSPSIDTVDACVLVSALMLSLNISTDIERFSCLVEVYRRATEEELRQRALVGWVFAMKTDLDVLRGKMMDIVAPLMKDASLRDDLLDMQKQVMYCISADSDTEKLQKEIIPGIIKHGSVAFGDGTFKDNNVDEDDVVNSILNPDAEEKAMDDLEKSMQKINDMQRNGSDIYFGGFCHMKRFAFFYQFINWFAPFFPEHPALQNAYAKLGDNSDIVESILDKSIFCDNDRYSFVLAFSSMIERLPQHIKNLMRHGGVEPVGGRTDSIDKKAPSFIRRMYLQTLYRFFKLCDYRICFDDPFENCGDNTFTQRQLFRDDSLPHGYFLACERMNFDELLPQRLKFARFLERAAASNKVVLSTLFTNIGFANVQAVILIAYGNLYGNVPLPDSLYDYDDHLRDILRDNPDNTTVLSLLGRICFEDELYDEGIGYYERLKTLCPGHLSYEVNYALMLQKAGRQDEGMQEAYRLSYLHPDDISVLRLLAWGQMDGEEYEKAEANYARITSSKSADAHDFMNAAYCAMLLDNYALAAERMSKADVYVYRHKGSDSILTIIGQDSEFLLEHDLYMENFGMVMELVRFMGLEHYSDDI